METPAISAAAAKATVTPILAACQALMPLRDAHASRMLVATFAARATLMLHKTDMQPSDGESPDWHTPFKSCKVQEITNRIWSSLIGLSAEQPQTMQSNKLLYVPIGTTRI
jgi:hypothetical protein